MKIAVFFELNGSQTGGAFSFNKMIYENLLKNRSSIHHELLVQQLIAMGLRGCGTQYHCMFE